jgi:hypothetical protein
MLDCSLCFHGFIYWKEDEADYFRLFLFYFILHHTPSLLPRKDTSYIILRLSAYLGDSFSNLTANESQIHRIHHYALPHGTCFQTVLSLQILSSIFVMNRPQCCLMLPVKKHVVFLLVKNWHKLCHTVLHSHDVTVLYTYC